ncbi:MAG TPA: sigma 54-interacting transcriptional regulator [Candidatus Tectomicrobia bacterium]|nr:sigma 54-interacting transcriptional regulator [Candidatus Tectomicrobia bacterium]
MAPLDEFVGESPGIRAIRDTVGRLLARGGRLLPVVLIQGETGSGKTLLARAMHRASARRDGPFVEHNCATTPDTLLASELFGAEPGAHTDARKARRGLFRLAHRGTFFLDEVGLMSEAMQATLLKVIEDRSVRPLGDDRVEPVPVDVWLIAATNTDLAEAVRQRRFRADLYHRIALVTLDVPPLRERGLDVVLLAERLLEAAARRHGVAPKRLDEGARAALLAHDWPGNVRELANLMERVTLLEDGRTVTRSLLQLGPSAPRETPGLRAARDTFERDRLLEALRLSGGNLSDAARRLKIPRNTFRYWLKRHGLLGDTEPPVVPAEADRTIPAATAPAPEPEDERPPSAGPAAAQPDASPERRHLAVVRAALEITAPDGEPTAGRAFDVLADKVETFGGRVEEWSPTGLLAVFGLEPTEDAPRRAALAATALVRTVEGARTDGAPMALRVALHVGRFQLAVGPHGPRIEPEARRHASAILDALLARAEAGTVAVSEAAVPFLDRRFDLAPMDAPPGDGGRVYRLGGKEDAGAGGRRRISPFVGRRRNIEMLAEHLATALRGEGQFVGIAGDPGIGKSRLLAEFRSTLAAHPVTYLEGACLSHATAIPYVPILAVLRQSCGLTDADDPETVRALVRRRLDALGLDATESEPYFHHLLGLRAGRERLAALTPEAIKLRTHQALRRMLTAACRERPLVVVVEDLHWTDPSSEELLGSLVADLPGTPLLFLATYRPGYRAPWIDRSFATQMALSPLSPEESDALVRAAADAALPETVTRAILNRAEGNPFFLEELCRAVAQGRKPPASLGVPDTVEQVIGARVARLPDEARRVLECAAVLGREFRADLLAAIAPASDAVDVSLRTLTQQEFLHARSAGPAPLHVFKHALTQEVVYAALQAERRQVLHGAAGRALESLFAGRLEEAYDRLAHHFARSDDDAKAVDYLCRFAGRAARGDAHEEAIRALGEALARADRLPAYVRDRCRLEVALRLPESLLRLGRIEELCTGLLQERERLERVGDPALAGPYFVYLARAFMLGQHQRAIEAARQAVAEAERCGDVATMGAALGVLAVARVLSSEARRGIDAAQRAVTLLEGRSEQWSLAYAYWALGLAFSQIAAFREAIDAERRALAIAEAIGASGIEASALWVIGIIHAARGEWDAGIAECERAVRRARDVLYVALTTGFLGFAHLQKGTPQPAIAALEQSITLLRRFGLRAFEAWFAALLAEAYRLDGALDRADEHAAAALDLATKAEFAVATGWAQQTLGRVAADRGDAGAAASRLHAALEMFARTESPYEQARTRVDLASVCRTRGERDAARAHLVEAWRLFTVLDVPVHRGRVEQLATEWAVPLDAGAAS